MSATQQRCFFKKSKVVDKEEDVKKESKEEQKEESKVSEEASEKETEVEGDKNVDEAKEEEKTADQTASSSDEEELSSADIKKIKALITEQDETIETYEKTIEELQADVKKFK
jgi:hypothetical protein